MPQRAERRQPAAPAILRRNVAARLVGLGGFYFGHGIDDLLRSAMNSPTLPEPISAIECLAAMSASLQRSPRGEAICCRESSFAFIDAAGHARTLELGAGESSAVRDGLALSARLEHALGGTIVRATVANRGARRGSTHGSALRNRDRLRAVRTRAILQAWIPVVERVGRRRCRRIAHPSARHARISSRA